MRFVLSSSRLIAHRATVQRARPLRQARGISLRAAAEKEAPSSNGTEQQFEGLVDFDELADIVRKVNETDIVELELKSRKFSLVVRKKEALEPEQPAVQYVPAPAAAGAAPPPIPAAPAPAPAAAPAATPKAAEPAPAPKVDGVEITSPMAGTLYRAPSPSDPIFVKEGDVIKKGQTICIIEAMKLMNEIEAEISGTVVSVLVDNASSVNPGQPIMIVKP